MWCDEARDCLRPDDHSVCDSRPPRLCDGRWSDAVRSAPTVAFPRPGGDMSDVRAGNDDPRVPLGAVPSPAARYAVADGTPVFTATNDAFETTFGVGAGTPVREWWSTAEIAADDLTAGGLCGALRDGETLESVGLRRPETPQRLTLQVLPTADDGGVMVLTPVERDGVEAERIASVVSHDLRNPLDVAGAHLQAAQETTDDDTVADHLASVDAAHDRMERIVRDVLTLARGEGAVTPEADVDLAAVVRRAWETVDTDPATLTVDDDLPTVEADPDRLRRLFENLFRNSVEHGSTSGRPASGDAVSVRVVAVDADGDTGGFAVADDGPGVPPAERDRVFVPGYSTDDTGTGLGLTIVRRIAEAHGWAVGLTESHAGGARVEIHLDGDRQ